LESSANAIERDFRSPLPAAGSEAAESDGVADTRQPAEVLSRWRERVARYRSGDPRGELLVQEKGQLITDLLASGLVEDQEAVLTLLELSDDDDLAALFNQKWVDVEALESAMTGHTRTRLDALWRRFVGGVDALRRGSPAVATGQPKGMFEPRELERRLANATREMIGDGVSLGDAETGLVDVGLANEILAYVRALPELPRRRATWWLGEQVVRMQYEIAPLDPDSDQAWAVRARLRVADHVLVRLWADIARGLTPQTLRRATFRPDAAQAEPIRQALAPIPTTTRGESGESGEFRNVVGGRTYEERLRQAASGVIKSYVSSVVEGRGRHQHRDSTKTIPMADLQPIATRAQHVIDALFGGLRTGKPLRVDRWWRRGNIHDQFADKDSLWALHSVRRRRKPARRTFMDILSWPNRLDEIRREHRARPRDVDGVLVNDEARIEHGLADELANDPVESKRLYKLRRGGPGFHLDGEIFVQRWREADEDAWATRFRAFGHEYLHANPHPVYKHYAKTFGSNSTEYKTLIEGGDDLLLHMAFAAAEDILASEDFLRDMGAVGQPPPQRKTAASYLAGVWARLRGRRPEHARARSLTAAEIWRADVTVLYRQYANVQRLIAEIGIENFLALYYLGEVDKIWVEPAVGTRQPAQTGSAAAATAGPAPATGVGAIAGAGATTGSAPATAPVTGGGGGSPGVDHQVWLVTDVPQPMGVDGGGKGLVAIGSGRGDVGGVVAGAASGSGRGGTGRMPAALSAGGAGPAGGEGPPRVAERVGLDALAWVDQAPLPVWHGLLRLADPVVMGQLRRYAQAVTDVLRPDASDASADQKRKALERIANYAAEITRMTPVVVLEALLQDDRARFNRDLQLPGGVDILWFASMDMSRTWTELRWALIHELAHAEPEYRQVTDPDETPPARPELVRRLKTVATRSDPPQGLSDVKRAMWVDVFGAGREASRQARRRLDEAAADLDRAGADPDQADPALRQRYQTRLEEFVRTPIESSANAIERDFRSPADSAAGGRDLTGATDLAPLLGSDAGRERLWWAVQRAGEVVALGDRMLLVQADFEAGQLVFTVEHPDQAGVERVPLPEIGPYLTANGVTHLDLPSPAPATRTRVWRYRSGEEGMDLTVTQKAKLLDELLVGAPGVMDEWAAVTILKYSDDEQLAEMFDPGHGLLPLVDQRVRSTAPRAELDRLFANRFDGGLEALRSGVVATRGQPARTFDRDRILELLQKPRIGEEEGAEPVYPGADPAVDRALAEFDALPLRERAEATRWLVDLSVLIAGAIDEEDEEDEQGEWDLKGTLDRVDLVLDNLFRVTAMALPDKDFLSEVTLVPPASMIDRLRAALVPPIRGPQNVGGPHPEFVNHRPDEEEDFEALLGKALGAEIDEDYRYRVEERPAEDEEDSPRLLRHFQHLADLASEPIEQVFRLLGPITPLRVHDGFRYFRQQHADMEEREKRGRPLPSGTRRERAREYLLGLLSRDDVTAVLLRHHARPVFGGDPISRDVPIGAAAESVERVFNKLINERLDKILDIYAAWEGRTDPLTNDVYVQPVHLSTDWQNQQYWWILRILFEHEEFHNLEGAGFRQYAAELGIDERDALREGGASLLTRIVFSLNAAQVFSDALRRRVERAEHVRYDHLAPLTASRMPHAVDHDYASRRWLMQLINLVGSVENFFAAYFFDQIEKIMGPIHAERDSVDGPVATPPQDHGDVIADTATDASDAANVTSEYLMSGALQTGTVARQQATAPRQRTPEPPPTEPSAAVPGAGAARRLADERRKLDDVAGRLLADLQAAVNPTAGSGFVWHGGLGAVDEAASSRVDHLLGPDVYGARAPKPAPAMLKGLDWSAFTPGQWVPLLRLMSMTRPGPRPTRAELDPANVPTTGRVASAARPEHLRSWGPNREPLPETVEIPELGYSIWMGSTLRDAGTMKQFRDNVAADFQRYYRAGSAYFLFTDIPWEVFDRARRERPTEGPLGDVWSMLQWAQTNGVGLVNIFELFNAENPMLLHALFMTEWVKQLPLGYVQAADILRLELLFLLGGLYTDGDNVFTRGLREEFARVAASEQAWATDQGEGEENYNNAVFMAPGGHPAIRRLLLIQLSKYAKTQRELYAAAPPFVPAWEGERGTFVGGPQAHLRREVFLRTGPVGPMTQLAQFLGLHHASALPHLQAGVRSTSGHVTWAKSTVDGAVAPPQDYDTMLAATKLIVSTLVRGVRNGEGVLDLMEVLPVVQRQPAPDAVWVDALTMVRDLVGHEVAWVADVRLEDSGVETAAILPAAARALIELTDPGTERWVLDQRQRPARMRRAHESWSEPPLQRLHEVRHGPDGRVDRVWLRTPEQAADRALQDAFDKMAVPRGYVGVWLDSRQGHAWVGDMPVTPAEVAALLDELGLGDRPVFLAMSEAAAPYVNFADNMWQAHGQPVRATDTLVSVHQRTGAVVASDRRSDAVGEPRLPPDGQFVEFGPGGRMPVPHDVAQSLPETGWVSLSAPIGRTQVPQPVRAWRGYGYGPDRPQPPLPTPPPRRLPTSFGDRGRIERIGAVPFGEHEQIAELIVQELPDQVPDWLREEVRGQAVGRLGGLGDRQASGRLLAAGFSLLG